MMPKWAIMFLAQLPTQRVPKIPNILSNVGIIIVIVIVIIASMSATQAAPAAAVAAAPMLITVSRRRSPSKNSYWGQSLSVSSVRKLICLHCRNSWRSLWTPLSSPSSPSRRTPLHHFVPFPSLWAACLPELWLLWVIRMVTRAAS